MEPIVFLIGLDRSSCSESRLYLHWSVRGKPGYRTDASLTTFRDQTACCIVYQTATDGARSARFGLYAAKKTL